MSAFQVSNHTIDVITQAAYKYRIISKRGRTLFGRQLMAANQQALHARYGDTPMTWAEINEAYTFTPLARKFKRAAVSGAIACFNVQACEDPAWATSEVKRLLDIADAKNARLAGFTDTVTPGEYVTDIDGEEVWQNGVVTQTAAAKMRDEDSTHIFYDINASQVDPESTDYVNSVMVRPIDLIRAERDAEAERIRSERMAAAAESHAAMNQADDADEEEWDDVDDDYEDDDEDADES